MARSSAFTKRFTTSMPREMYNAIDRRVEEGPYASISHAIRELLKVAMKRRKRLHNAYLDECDKFGVEPEV